MNSKELQISKEEQQRIDLYLKDPMLLDRLVLDGLDEVIVGEDSVRKVIFLCAVGAMVKNATRTSYNLLVNSDSGAGKDHIVHNVLKVLPKEMITKRTRISPTALTYWHNSTFEPNWSWNEKVLYLEDCSNAVLNCDVFKVFTSGGSFATIVKDQRAIDIEIKGKPVVIITSASAEPEPELVRRFLVINLTENEDQTKEVMDKWADYGTNGQAIPTLNNEYHKAMRLIYPRKVKIPWAKKITKYFPYKHIIMRTHFARFLDFVKASAVLHQYARKIDADEFVLANGQDYDYARIVMLTTSSNDRMIPLTKNQQEVITIFRDLGLNIINEGLNEQEIGWTFSELLSKIPLSQSQLYRELTKLVKSGFIEKDLFQFDYNVKKQVVYNYKKQNPLLLPLWKDV